MTAKKAKPRTPTNASTASTASERLFWSLAAKLRRGDARIVEGTIMNGRCLRVREEFLALVDYKGSGLVVKLPLDQVIDLIDSGIGQPFAPAGRVFKEWVSIPEPNRKLWGRLLGDGVAFVSKALARKVPSRR